MCGLGSLILLQIEIFLVMEQNNTRQRTARELHSKPKVEKRTLVNCVGAV